MRLAVHYLSFIQMEVSSTTIYSCLLVSNIVLVDTNIVSEAPARLLISGMGDAWAAYFDASTCKQSNAKKRIELCIL